MRPEYQPDAFGLDNNLIMTLPQRIQAKRKALQNTIADFKPDIIHSVLFNSNLLVRTIRVFDSSFVHIESLVNHTYSSNRLNEAGSYKI